MSRPPKPVAQSKRVAPPAVPDIYRHSGSSFGSAGYGSSDDASVGAHSGISGISGLSGGYLAASGAGGPGADGASQPAGGGAAGVAAGPHGMRGNLCFDVYGID